MATDTPATMDTFDPTQRPARGVNLLEASAGTGKTYAITNLVIQLVGLCDVPLDQILVVTFTRNATAELRERVRKRLLQATQAVRSGEADDDPVLQQLVDAHGDDPQVGPRLARALQSFDTCVIRTIHGFCQRMLATFAPVAGVDVDLELDPDATRLLGDLVDDWISRELYPDDPVRYTFLKKGVGCDREKLLGLARTVTDQPELVIQPDPMPDAYRWLLKRRDALWASWEGGWEDEVTQLLRDAKRDKRLSSTQQILTDKTLTGTMAAVRSWLREDIVLRQESAAHNLLRDAVDHVTVGEPLDHPAFDALTAFASDGQLACAATRAWFAHWVRDAFDAACAAERVQPYAALVRGLADRVAPHAAVDPATAATRDALIEGIGGTFQAALIDEFQDTDDAQWTLFSEVFGGGRHYLYLIGDPKQAIYGFRGANINVYLAARGKAPLPCTMRRNYRSDQPLLDALNHLMDRDGFFGSAGIRYVPVDAPERHRGSRLVGGEALQEAPVQLRLVDASSCGVPADGFTAGAAVAALPDLVAQDVAALLSSGAQVRRGSDKSAPLCASDVAVLVRTGAQGDDVQQALRARGVPSVQVGRNSVFHSVAARALELWFAALLQPGREGAARAAATTVLFGRDADLLLGLEAQDPAALAAWDRWLEALGRWRATLAQHGFLRALREALDDEQVAARLLTQRGGERTLTDLLHTAELMHAAQTTDDLQHAGLLAWLRAKRHDQGATTPEDAEVRLERDDDAVAVMTVHKSKGLQFPVVFEPWLWKPRGDRSPYPVAPHPDDPTRRVLDLLGTEDAKLRKQREDDDERMRLLYVAWTRAEHRLVVYTVPGLTDGSAHEVALPAERLEALRTDPLPSISPSICPPAAGDPTTYSPPATNADTLSARSFGRGGLDRAWRRHSYSSMVRGARWLEPVVTEREGFDPDPDRPIPDAPLATDVPADAPDVPLAAFPTGTKAGLFLHEVLERVDFRAEAPDAAPPTGGLAAGSLDAVVPELLAQHAFDATWQQPVTDGLRLALRTPLGGPLGATRLCDIPRDARFDELSFDFPLAGGDAWGKPDRSLVTARQLTDAIRLRPPDGRMGAAYLDKLASMDFAHLAGFMTGSVDLIFRATQAREDHPRWYVVDYKSNRIDPQRTGRTPVEHFGLAGMRHALEGHDYYLQYHLYTVALHRYLRWRVPDYRYERDFGGVYYLFLRGMIGPDTPTLDGDVVAGCFYDRPPVAVIDALDAAFGG